MKKIAIVTRKMITGGIEKALISMLEIMLKDKFDITLFVMARGGEFEEYIPKQVKIKCLYGEEKSIKEKIIGKLKRADIIGAIKIPLYTALAIKAKKGYEQERYLSKILPKQTEKFDLAIAYHTPASFPVIYVSEHLNAKKKVAWIHSDVEVYKNELENYIDYYEKFEKIYCVSKYGKDKFDNQYHKMKNKTDVIYNIINNEQIYNLADEYKAFEDNFDGIRILTVGRLTKQKGTDIIPKIIYTILENRFNIRWYVVGDGEERENIINEIKVLGLEERLILVGTKNNPYPYFKECDIYVQPSRHEGYCLTLAEAKRFNKPIVTTDFVGAVEQIKNNETGLIVRFDEREIEESIIKIIEDDELRDKFILNLNKYRDINNLEMEKLYTLME
ncbi:glycosyltransferase [Clostridium saudiense]|uniref:glycosyltransferase n=1 Tax=Clostridium saudiense TaxID=1414720 RepID=UPI0004B16255|nr:glycosyltransferase [Clostridium saudiense]